MRTASHTPTGDLHRVYDAFLRGLPAMTRKVGVYLDLTQGLTGEWKPRNIPRLASLGHNATYHQKGLWTPMLCVLDVSGAASPVAYLRPDGCVHGLVRDYSIEHVNNLSLLVGNGDMLTLTIHRDENGEMLPRRKPTWMWGDREVGTHEYLTISAPLMTQVYRLTKHPKASKKQAEKP